ncbi:hypothetical protein AURDEDRAFT_177256 [Auricularia subglabra TFB-10046 SS5]|uniref:Uncharacterized protein n=1 Tax=Auricularia subglabra (strain TFB-10046 / SS5) TaxID=717982 RepID=J0D4I5_AURST|nr:hypothetical protein AURDEDRAFT_177256 [Auricularia subglabra TFB-10046 SS5]
MLKNEFPALKSMFLRADAVRGTDRLRSQFTLALESLAVEIATGHCSAILDHFDDTEIVHLRTTYFDGIFFRRFRPSNDRWARMTISTFTNPEVSVDLRFDSESGARLDITHVGRAMLQILPHATQFAHVTELVLYEAAVEKHGLHRLPDLPSVVTLVILVRPSTNRPPGSVRFFAFDRGDEPLVKCAGLLNVEIVCPLAGGPLLLDEHDLMRFLTRDIKYDTNKLISLSLVGVDLASQSAYSWGTVAEGIDRRSTSSIPGLNRIINT